MNKNPIILSLLVLLNCQIKKPASDQWLVPVYWDFMPSWSPDGQKIVFASTRASHPTQNIFVINLDGTGLKQLTFSDSGYGNNFPAYSPDGNRIAYISDRGDSVRSVFIMQADGSGQKQLTDDQYQVGNQPVFSPDGNIIYFELKEASNSDIWSISPETGMMTRVTQFEWNASDPGISPDGKWLAFTTRRFGNNEVEMINLETGVLDRLTNYWSDDGSPSWSADGKYVYFYSNRHEPKYEIYKVNIDSKAIQRITNSPNWDLEARESPDGTLITFHSSLIGRNSITVTDVNGGNRRLLTNTEVTPFIDLVFELGLNKAKQEYPKALLDSLNTIHSFNEEMLWLSYKLLDDGRPGEAREVAQHLVDHDLSSWSIIPMTNEVFKRLGDQTFVESDIYQQILSQGVDVGIEMINKHYSETDRQLFSELEFITFTYWYHFNGHYEQSIKLLKHYLRYYPDSFKAYHDLANSYKETGQIDLAIKHHQKAVELDPDGWYGQDSQNTLKALL